MTKADNLHLTRFLFFGKFRQPPIVWSRVSCVCFAEKTTPKYTARFVDGVATQLSQDHRVKREGKQRINELSDHTSDW